MSIKLEFTLVSEENKSNFRPIQRKLNPFESWSMEMIYACLAHETIGDVDYSVRDVTITNVWNGNELYNTDWQIMPKDGRKSRLWMTEDHILMLELIYEDMDTPNDLYFCH
jgi:hypothetical protein